MSQTGYTLYECTITQIKLYSFQYFFFIYFFCTKKLFLNLFTNSTTELLMNSNYRCTFARGLDIGYSFIFFLLLSEKNPFIIYVTIILVKELVFYSVFLCLAKQRLMAQF